MIKSIPNVITICRIIGAGLLLLVPPLSSSFFILYIICGITDILDGFIARKMNCESEIGSLLDSIADFVLIIVLFYIFIPVIPVVPWIISWVTGIALCRFFTMIIGFHKYRSVAFLHTIANKVSGFSLFCFPVFYKIWGISGTAVVLCSIASLSAIEELIITIKSSELDRNIGSLFLFKKID